MAKLFRRFVNWNVAVVVRAMAVLGTWLLFGALTPVAVHAATTQGADVGVTVTGPSQLQQGAHAEYGVTYVNNGPATATNTYVLVTLDPQLYWDPFDTTGNCTNTTPQGIVKQYTFVCPVGSLAAGTSGSFQFAIQAFSSTPLGTYKAMFSIAADQSDSKQQNNTAVDHIAVVAPYNADVWTDIVRDYANSYPYTTGETIWLDAQYGNTGPAAATNAVETFTLPATFTFDSTNSDSRCTGTGQTVTCALGDVPVNSGSLDVVIAFEPTAGGVYNVTASITADQPDPDSSNNSSTDTINIS